MGTDTRNLGFLAFNVLFLRAHNKTAKLLARDHPRWDSDRLFQTSRMILIVVLIRIVVEEYINHITGYWFRFSLDPASFKNEPWQRTNRMAIEFNLLYRWHSLVASPIEFDGAQLTIEQTLQNADALIDAGLGRFMIDASQQRSGRIALFNTDRFLVENAERPSIEQGRRARLGSYNDYRELATCRGRPTSASSPLIRVCARVCALSTRAWMTSSSTSASSQSRRDPRMCCRRS